ncbi:hypothetical protein RAS1_33850 [Phycisphaerae bacterium RAS1]|nr:hypothetical protein RAS1_33850 [Phycisphaerae bacterium RAS1]
MIRTSSRLGTGLAILLFAAGTAPAGSHLWQINEVFSNADGTIQYVEMRETMGADFEIYMLGLQITSNSSTFTFDRYLDPPTGHRHLLIATAAFAALPGAPVPDFLLPDNFLSTGGDTLVYYVYDAWTFGPLPTDGVNSLRRDGLIGPNSPTNYSGATGSINAPACSGPCGDSNCDGQVNVLDINAFVTAVSDRAAWEAKHDCSFCCANDVNADGAVNVLDINGFVNAVGSGGCSGGNPPCLP